MSLARNNSAAHHSSPSLGENFGSFQFQFSECRICHDEDLHSNMESPCFCRGSLKYAHRECIQRWCNEKGDAICEICLEDFKPGYTAPPPSFHSGEIPFQLRGSWELFRTDLQTPHFMTMVADDNDDSIESDFYDCPIPPSRSLMCCRAVAITFVVLLLLRYTLPIISYDVGEYPMTFLMLMMFRAITIVLSIYIVMRTLAAARCRQRQQDTGFHVAPLGVDEESDISHLQQAARPPFMQVH